jgi:hypothetical protein
VAAGLRVHLPRSSAIVCEKLGVGMSSGSVAECSSAQSRSSASRYGPPAEIGGDERDEGDAGDPDAEMAEKRSEVGLVKM